jgi:intracellular sulfur oxidation DsrE/DsrF family protein
MNERYSDRLQAFVDGQLDPADRARVLEEMERDATLRERACELRRLKEAVACAFDDLPAAPPAPRARRWPWRKAAFGVAASLLLPLGFLLGRISAPPPLEGFSDIAQPAMQLVASPQDSRRVVLHVDEGDPGKFLVVLESAEDLMYFLPEGEVDVIVNAGGLDLVRADRSPYAERVAELMAEHPNMRFVACNITMDKQRAQGDEPVLVRGTRVAPSAAEHILQRMEQGWVYLRV